MSRQEFTFDKFMSDLLRKEQEKKQESKRRPDEERVSPRRKLDMLYRERWQNRIRWGRK